MIEIETTKVWLANFSSSSETSKLSRVFLENLGFSSNYQTARLAIGRSLGETSFPDSAPDSKGNSIKGNILFGDEEKGGLLWLAVFVENIYQHFPNKKISMDLFQQVVRDHWHRGMLLLQSDWEEVDGDYSKFVELLITRRAALPLNVENSNWVSNFTDKNLLDASPIWLEIGKLKKNNELARWLINGVGYAPNIALMGQAGSGKTRTMLNLVKQVKQQSTGLPVILLDLGKGDLARDANLAKLLNAKVLEIPEQAIPLDMFFRNEDSDSAAHVLQGFRDSFEKSMQSKPGAKQLDAFREALKPIFQKKERINIQDIKSSLDNYYTENKIKTDSILATINDLIQFKLFEPMMSPEEFFSQSWIITFGHAQDTTKKLASCLLIDALHNYLKSCQESPVDSNGHRGLRLLLAIDESRTLLANRHPGLSNLLRLHRSKGLSVMLASQSPDDYEGAADDYLEQIGIPICFRTNATSTSILNNMFKSSQNFSMLESGECYSVIDNTTQRIIAF
jgi:DNA sulfur modification protein DndE